MGTTGTRRVENGDAPPPQYEEAISGDTRHSRYQHLQLQLPDTKVNLPTWA